MSQQNTFGNYILQKCYNSSEMIEYVIWLIVFTSSKYRDIYFYTLVYIYVLSMFKYKSVWDIFHIVLKWFILYIQSHCDTFSLLLSKYFLQAILQSQTIFIVSMEVRLVFNAVLQYLFAFALEYFSYGNGGAADVLTRKQRCMFRWCILETKTWTYYDFSSTHKFFVSSFFVHNNKFK